MWKVFGFITKLFNKPPAKENNGDIRAALDAVPVLAKKEQSMPIPYDQITAVAGAAANEMVSNIKKQLAESINDKNRDAMSRLLEEKMKLVMEATADFAKDKDVRKYDATMQYIRVSGLATLASTAIDLEAAAKVQAQMVYDTAISTALSVAKILIPMLVG
jgi:hypothetical protein